MPSKVWDEINFPFLNFIIFHRDWYFFILFTAATDKRYLTLYKLVISITIIIIIINKWHATISGVADENIGDVGNLHK